MRVIPLTEYSARRAASLTESLIYSNVPTLAFFQWKPSITLPYSQQIEDVNLEICAKKGIEVARIIGGGRAYVHGDDFSLALVRPLKGDVDITKEMKWLCEKVCSALNELGINAQVKRRTYLRDDKEKTDGYDVEIDGKKVAGYAARKKEENFLIHGAFVYKKPNLSNWLDFFNIPSELDKNKMVKQIEKYIVPLSDYTKETPESICQILAKHIMPQHTIGGWANEELEFSKKLENELYSGSEWKKGGTSRGLCHYPWGDAVASLKNSMRLE